MPRGCHKQLRAWAHKCGCQALGDEVVVCSDHACDITSVTQSLNLAFQIWEPPEVPHLCRAVATSSCARRRTRECGCQALGAEVVTRGDHVCAHTNVTQTLNLVLQIWGPPKAPHLCRAGATNSCARGRTRECGCLACGAEVVARSAHAGDHTNVTQTLILASQI